MGGAEHAGHGFGAQPAHREPRALPCKASCPVADSSPARLPTAPAACWENAQERCTAPAGPPLQMPAFEPLLDWLVGQSDNASSPLYGLVDMEQLAVAGHSRGGKLAALLFAGAGGLFPGRHTRTTYPPRPRALRLCVGTCLWAAWARPYNCESQSQLLPRASREQPGALCSLQTTRPSRLPTS